jgi:hypothetical protein
MTGRSRKQQQRRSQKMARNPQEAPEAEGPAEQVGTGAEPPAVAPEVSAPAIEPKVKGAMPYLGTISPDGLRQVKERPGAANHVIVVRRKSEPDGFVGVVVTLGPGYGGASLARRLEDAGHRGPFEFLMPASLHASAKHAVALAIAHQGDPAVDVSGSLASFGYRKSMLGL